MKIWRIVKIVPEWKYFDRAPTGCENDAVPRSRYDQIVALAEEYDGLITSKQARYEGLTDSLLARLTKRGKIKRIARGVYRIPYIPLNRFSQYREVFLWVQSHRGPALVAFSHETALAAYGFSDANPAAIHLTVPPGARLRRNKVRGVVLHRREIKAAEITTLQGLPLTTVERTVADLIEAGARIDLIKQLIDDARREGFTTVTETRRLRRGIDRYLKTLQKRRVEPGSLKRSRRG